MIKVGWLKWRLAFGVLCDRRIPTRLKGEFCRTSRSATTYGVGCWPIKNQHISKMSITKMRMLRWMCGKTKNNRIRNERFRVHLRVALIDDKIREIV